MQTRGALPALAMEQSGRRTPGGPQEGAQSDGGGPRRAVAATWGRGGGPASTCPGAVAVAGRPRRSAAKERRRAAVDGGVATAPGVVERPAVELEVRLALTQAK